MKLRQRDIRFVFYLEYYIKKKAAKIVDKYERTSWILIFSIYSFPKLNDLLMTIFFEPHIKVLCFKYK